MKAGWQLLRLGAVCEFDKSQGIHAGLPYVGLEDIESKTARFIGSEEPQVVKSSTFKFSAQHVLYGRLRPYLNKVLAPEFAGHCSTEIFPIKPSPALSREYLLYWFLSDETVERINATCTGARMPRADMNEVLDFDFPIPPLPEQQRIVTLLDEAFDGIATAKAHAEKNLQNARAIFESHLQSVFTQRGDGRVEKRLADVCAITSMLIDPRKAEYQDLTHVGAGNIESKTGVFVELKTAREEGLISGKFLFDESMVLYSKIRPYLMKVARPDFNGLCSADMYPLAPIPGVADKDYLFHLLLSKHFTDYAIEGSARAGMPKVNREHLFEFRVCMPSVGKQREIAVKLDELHDETQRLESLYQQKLTALDELKKSLLHRAFSGAL